MNHRTRDLFEEAKRLRLLTYFTRHKAMQIAGRAYMLCREAAALRTKP